MQNRMAATKMGLGFMGNFLLFYTEAATTYGECYDGHFFMASKIVPIDFLTTHFWAMQKGVPKST
jgi:hypothetical protein